MISILEEQHVKEHLVQLCKVSSSTSLLYVMPFSLCVFFSFLFNALQQTRNPFKKVPQNCVHAVIYNMKPFWKIPGNCILGIIIYNETVYKKGKETDFQGEAAMGGKGTCDRHSPAFHNTTLEHLGLLCFANVLTDCRSRNTEPMINGLSRLWHQAQGNMWLNALTGENPQQISEINVRFKI